MHRNFSCRLMGIALALGAAACSGDKDPEPCPDLPPCIAGSKYSAATCACVLEDEVPDAGDRQADGKAATDYEGGDGSASEREASDAPRTVDERGDTSLSCVIDESSTLPHVRIAFRSTACTFTLAQAAAGISIPYDVIVDQDVTDFAPLHGYPYGADVANLDLNETLSGANQTYCLCDQGLPLFQCPGMDGGFAPFNSPCGPITIPAGVYHRQFTWDGHNWSGPSDTSNPKGPPFPAGDYVLSVSTSEGSIGDSGSYKATGKFAIRLVR